MKDCELLTVLRVNKNRIGNIVSYTCRVGDQTKNFSYEQLLKYIMAYKCVNARIGAEAWECLYETPEEFVVVFVNSKSVIVKVHNHKKARVPANWEYITVKRGEISDNERRFTVTTTDGRMFEPDEDVQKRLHIYLVFDCGVFYQYKTVKNVDSILLKMDSKDPWYLTYYYFDSKQSNSGVYTFQVLRDKNYLVMKANTRFEESDIVRLSVGDLYSLGSWTKKKFLRLTDTEDFCVTRTVRFIFQPI